MPNDRPKSARPSASNQTKSPTLASTVEQRLRRDLALAVFMPGEKLFIDALRERYGTGLSPVREALNRLSAEGLVVQSDQRGFRVPPVSVRELEDLTRARCLMNEITLREAIAHADETSDEAIVLALHRLSRTPPYDPEDPERINIEWEERHRAFHASLIAPCGLRWLLEFDALLFEQSSRYRALTAHSHRPRDVAKEHQAMADAVLARDTDLALRLLNAHISHTSELVKDIARRHETSSGPVVPVG